MAETAPGTWPDFWQSRLLTFRRENPFKRIWSLGNRSGTRADRGAGLDTVGIRCMQTLNVQTLPGEPERLAYSIHEAADLLGVDYLSVYRLIQRGKLRACRALRGKLLIPRSELLRLLKG
jgi:excisionase family DNA binding protein